LSASVLPAGAQTAVRIKSAKATGAISGVKFSFTVETVGTPVPALKERGTLPANVSFRDNHNGTGTLTGTPKTSTATTVYDVSFVAVFGTGATATTVKQPFTLTVLPSADATWLGDWSGNVTETGSSTSYPVKVAVHSVTDVTVGLVRYPTMKCSGVLSSATVTPQKLHFTETIVGHTGCVNGKVTMTLTGATTASWAGNFGSVKEIGTLTRTDTK
jgi:hypothetical protein